MKHENPIYHQNCGSMKYFNNLTTAGVLVRGIDNITQQRSPELAASIEEVEVLSMFN